MQNVHKKLLEYRKEKEKQTNQEKEQILDENISNELNKQEVKILYKKKFNKIFTE